MKVLILAAGYATRLYPLTENFPKPLLEVAGKPILDHLIDDLERVKDTLGKPLIDGYVIVSNHKFADIFRKWIDSHPIKDKLLLVDDGTMTNETRLGAVKDIELGIDEAKIDDDLLVMAGDNLLSFSLEDFVKYSERKGTTCIMRFYEENEEKLHKCGIAEVDSEDRIISMEEKPLHPKSHWICPPFYIYRKEDLKLIPKGIEEGCGTDAPGSFIAWLCTKTAVHAYEMPGRRYDIGNLESYEQVKREYISPIG